MIVTNWVVALKPEAKPLIEHFAWKRDRSRSENGFEVFSNEGETQRLIISGVGKIASASAVTWLGARRNPEETLSLWVNFGIAGNRDASLGSVFRAGRIKDAGNGKSRYPTKPQKTKLASAELLTVDQPTFDYPSPEWLVEMEASGFANAAIRFSSLEWIQSIKVISDNAESDPKLIRPAMVTELCQHALPAALPFVEQWETSARDFASQTESIDCSKLLDLYHFTETESHQLRRLVQRAIVLGKITQLDEWADAQTVANGKALLKNLRALLANTKGTKD